MNRLPVVFLALSSLGLSGTAEPRGPRDPIKVFILAGQSNMEGKAKVSLLEYQLGQPGTKEQFAHLRKGGEWVERDDVWIKFLDHKGNLTVGYGSPKCLGPELEFGNVVGDHYDEQVLIIKTAWGGKSLYRDFRPPSAGLPETAVLEQLLENDQKRKPETTIEEVRESFGRFYREMLAEVAGTLENLEEHFPAYDGQGYEIAGFVWFQGWNDMIDADYTAEYADNMAHFITDVRRDLGVEDLPFVIGQFGVGGPETGNEKHQAFKDAQAAAAQRSEFRGNVAVVKTDAFWDEAAQAVFDKGWKDNIEEWNTVGSDYPYHYLGSVRTYSGIGKAFGVATLALCAGHER